MYPEFLEFVQSDVLIVTLLLKAMCECVQASKLWYNLLTKVLQSRGYVEPETDPCAMRHAVKGMISIILIYVDDLLIFAMQAEMNGIRIKLTKALKSITVEVGMSLSYLGMKIEWSNEGFTLGMNHYIEQLVKDWPTVLFHAATGTKDTFKIDLESPMLCEKDRKLFHMTVARILYIAKHILTDALTITSF